MKSFITIIAFLLAINASAKPFYKATILYTNGQTAEGYASLPSNDLFSGNISYKENEEGQPIKQEDDDIVSVTYYTESGNAYFFEHTPARQLDKTFGSKFERTAKKKIWMLRTFSHDLISMYYFSQSYYFDRQGKLISQTVDRNGGWADLHVLYKRPGENVPTFVSSFTAGAKILNQQSTFRRRAKLYFEGDEKFVERIDNKEFRHDEVYKLAEEYVIYKQGTLKD